MPNNAPIPAVIAIAIARAPQKATQIVAAGMFAPPVLAPTAPRKATNSKDAAATDSASALSGARITVNSGRAAPTENDIADVSAA